MAVGRDQVLQTAEKYLARGKLEAALKEYLRLLEENPKDISTLNKVGDLYVRMNRPADSVPFFTRIADFYARDGFFLKAIAIYKKINKIDPSLLEVYDRLADLYHKQGLTQDARSQYQVLADHYQKSNKIHDTIAAYKKMAAVDPNDLKIQVRLADLFRSSHQTDQAVMQYGLVGSMLLRRGANDEAAAVFQKALEISPNDAGIQKSLVKSLLAQKNPAAAIAVLKAAPRTADSLALLAEAQLEMAQRTDAGRAVEEAIALEAHHEGARLLLSRIRANEADIDGALQAVTPIVDAALTRGEAARAAGYLAPILEVEPAHSATLRRMAEVREAEGNLSESAALRFQLGQQAERSGDTAAAIESYRRALKAVPGHEEATARLKEIAPSFLAPPPGPPPPEPEVRPLTVDASAPFAPLHAPQPVVPSIKYEPAPVLPVRPRAPAAEQDVETLVVEAEVFAKYGLTDKAVERLRSIVRRRPDLLKARERLVELMAETQNAALTQEAGALAKVYREAGRDADAEALLSRVGGEVRAAPAPPPSLTPSPAPAVAPPIEFEEFEIDLPPLPAHAAPEAPAAGEFAGAPPVEPMTPLPAEGFGNQAIRFASPAQPPAAESPPLSASGSKFVSYGELGTLLEEEMQRAGETAPAEPPPEAPVLDEQNLFADEQQFFNLAEELEKELGEDTAPPSPATAVPEGEVSLEEIFREFKKGVEQQLSSEDYETHFNLGIAYKEMGLVDEAIGEFQLASKDPARTIECCSMLGLCFLEKGMPQLAVQWYRKGLEAPDIREAETVGLLYDLAGIYQSTGDLDLAYRTYLEVYGLNTNYRDVAHRVKDLEAVKKS